METIACLLAKILLPFNNGRHTKMSLLSNATEHSCLLAKNDAYGSAALFSFRLNGNAGGFDLSVDGTLTLSHSSASFVYGTGASGEFLSGGKFILNRNGGGGGAVPLANWAPNSTVQITGVTSTVPTQLSQSFGNF